MSNVRLSLPLRWSAFAGSEPLRPSAQNNEEPGFRRGVGGLWEQKQFVHCIVITVISSHMQRKQHNVKSRNRGENSLLLV